MKQLWDIGLQEYVNDMWNVIDFVTNSLYVATVALRVVSYFQVFKSMNSTLIRCQAQFNFPYGFLHLHEMCVCVINRLSSQVCVVFKVSGAF